MLIEYIFSFIFRFFSYVFSFFPDDMFLTLSLSLSSFASFMTYASYFIPLDSLGIALSVLILFHFQFITFRIAFFILRLFRG